MLRTYNGLEDKTEEEANEIINQLEELATILYKYAENEGLFSIPTIHGKE